MDLLTAAERIASMDRPPLELKTSDCLHTLDKLANCDACLDLCPVEAIQPGKPPSLDIAKCLACFACLPACPVGAFSAVDVVNPLLDCATRAHASRLELLCEPRQNANFGPAASQVAIWVRGCLSGLGVGAYLLLIAMGLEDIFIRMDACDQCPWGTLQSRIETQVGNARKMLSAWGLTDRLVLITEDNMVDQHERPVWSADNPPMSRRDLFRLSSYLTQPAVVQTLTSEAGGIGNDRISPERRRIIAAVAHFPERVPMETIPALDHMRYAEVSISDECIACGVCARACPTGALQFSSQNDEIFRLTFVPLACIACDICMQICPVNAVSVDHQPSFDYVFGDHKSVVLCDGELTRCQRCNTLMAAKTGSKYCSLCEFRRKNPFGAALPPGFKGDMTIAQHNENPS